MAAENPPYALQSASHSAELFRRAYQAIVTQGGVVAPGDLAVTANGTPNMSVNVAAGQIVIPGTLGSTTGMPTGLTSQGAYYGYNDATVNLVIAAADPTNPRIDLVVASVQDSYYSGTNNQWVIQVIAGTPAPSPSAPAVPVSSIVLAQVAVAANASSIGSGNITDERSFMGLVESVRMFGEGSGTTGVAPGGTKFLAQGGTTVVTTNVNGVATVPFPTAFPNGVLTTLANVGDWSGTSTPITLTQVQAAATLAHFEVVAYSGNGYLASGPVRVNWFSVGW